MFAWLLGYLMGAEGISRGGCFLACLVVGGEGMAEGATSSSGRIALSRPGHAQAQGCPLCPLSPLLPNAHTTQATEMVYYPDQWSANMHLLKHFTQEARGIRCSGAAATNLCHLASGVWAACHTQKPNCRF